MSREAAMLGALLGAIGPQKETKLVKHNFETEDDALNHAARVAAIKPGDRFFIRKGTKSSVETIRCVARKCDDSGIVSIYRWHREEGEIVGGQIAPSFVFFEE